MDTKDHHIPSNIPFGKCLGNCCLFCQVS